jgi:hypothetical protein
MSTAVKTRPAWKVGDQIIVGNVRWIIRILRGQHVELEAANVPAGIWWSTTLDRLPAKEVH